MENSTDPDFAQFWSLYPRKVAKKDAEKAWKKLTPPEKSKAIAAIPKHAALWEDPHYIPHASTWINGARWEDQIEHHGATLKQVVSAWWTTHEGVEAKARELHLTPRMGESWAKFKERVAETDRMSRATRAA